MNPGIRTWAFRGQANATWPLLSSLSRYFAKYEVNQRVWQTQEWRILRIFRSKAHLFLDHVPPYADSFQWLALLQHHGSPTRLLDLTWSPYVGAFFALEGATCDAAIWAFNSSRIMPFKRSVTLPEGEEIHPWDISPMFENNYEKYFLPGTKSFVVISNPSISNKRLTAQSGTFLVPARLDTPVENILNSYPGPKDMIRKFILKKEMRAEAMRELYYMNITNATLFPDLDGLARSMAYEFEVHWAFDPRTAIEHSGYEGYLASEDDQDTEVAVA
jgi:hypothetical protein